MVCKEVYFTFLIMPFINLFFRENESNKIRRAFLVVLMAIVLIPSTLELAGGGYRTIWHTVKS